MSHIPDDTLFEHNARVRDRVVVITGKLLVLSSVEARVYCHMILLLDGIHTALAFLAYWSPLG